MNYVKVSEIQDMDDINEHVPENSELVEANSLDNQNDDTSPSSIRMIRAAMPHLNYRTQKSMNMVLRATELMDTIHSFNDNSGVSAMELENDTVDVEAMLTDMRKVSVGREGEMIDNMLNLIRVRELYQTYQSLAASGSENKNSGGNPFGSLFGGGGGGNFNMMDMLSSFMSPEQKSQFDNISMIMSMMS